MGLACTAVDAPDVDGAIREIGAMLDQAYLSDWPEHMTFSATPE